MRGYLLPCNSIEVYESPLLHQESVISHFIPDYAFKSYLLQLQLLRLTLLPFPRSSEMADIFQSCCLTSFPWSGTPSGREEKLAGLPTYITGDSTSAAVLFVHDALGWQFGNARLLADCYAKEVTHSYSPTYILVHQS
jgi:hypothetical protein